MKTKCIWFGLFLAAVDAHAQSISTNSYSGPFNATIPAGNPSGVLEQFSVSGVTGTITDIQVSLDISGGYNGDLYVWLADPTGQKSILLNRPGLTTGDPFGYGDAGFSITLDDNGSNSNIHSYGSSAYSVNGNGQVTSTYASDGRDIDPQSSPDAFDSASTAANLSQYLGGDANGTWSLFLADMVAGGDSATLNDATLTVETQPATVPTPEPSVVALLTLGAAAAGYRLRRQAQK